MNVHMKGVDEDFQSLDRFVRTHVTDRFRSTFFELERRALLDRSCEMDLFYLQHTFVPVVQQALDEFRDMWNNHLIRGVRSTVFVWVVDHC